MKVILRKATFLFPKLREEEARILDIFKWDEKTFHLLKIIIFLVHQIISAPRASKITISSITVPQVTRITPLDPVEEASFNHRNISIPCALNITHLKLFQQTLTSFSLSFRLSMVANPSQSRP